MDGRIYRGVSGSAGDIGQVGQPGPRPVTAVADQEDAGARPGRQQPTVGHGTSLHRPG
ncbi:hypothetical protein [Nonomuraea sp. NPDC050202]|uniref:hypothetical protein n=1 Tax=Nonomuraea sp. NPDC050202 TaxID=3155035 RepID=UPI0033C633C2